MERRDDTAITAPEPVDAETGTLAPVLDDEVGGRPDHGDVGRSRYLPAVLDALIPGLGHLVAGRRRDGRPCS